ncbi:putative Vitelline membrane outer layer protein 1-like protein [Hypsibius exemplaris]|uniref:Vitelline membrane outer layer protein 1-like protein n=1 Tax=Hypsibius exemplaris TaxID=2072580 RepID=A0A9X6ND84_HYPEX|nr:putative Vitelline membrane outer layer protein 1-like protein [Hypsibius exemplaris]
MAFFALFLLTCLAVDVTYAARAKPSNDIASPQVTNWGTWSTPSFCPSKEFVVGMQLRTEPDQGSGDDSALNAIRFLCARVPYNGGPETSTATPHDGFWGTWGKKFYCKNDEYAVGFQLRSEKDQGKGDDSAANNLRLLCGNIKNPKNIYTMLDQVEGDGMQWGDWTAVQTCPEMHVMCGLKVQVEEQQGSGDDSALNNLVASCCSLL